MTPHDTIAYDLRELAGRLVRCAAGGYAGQRGLAPAEDVFLESGEHLEALAGADGLVHASTVIFAPEGTAGTGARPSGATVIGYEGALALPGDEVVLADEFYLQVQDYVGSAFLAVAGPTLVRVATADDVEAFLADADAALADGTFPMQLTHPAIQLADTCCLAGAPACPGLARLHVSVNGEVRTAAGGAVLGAVGDGRDRLTAALHRLDGPPCAHGAVRDALWTASRDRPWLARYVAALEALRRMHGRGSTDCRVSGFGHRLVSGLDPEQREAPALPLLLWDDGECVLFDMSGRRALRLGRDAGRLAELLLVAGSSSAAAPLAERLLDIDAALARHVLDALATRLPPPALRSADPVEA